MLPPKILGDRQQMVEEIDMNAKDYWSIFLETGAPEAYLSYTKALKMEGNHVFDGSGHRTQSYGLQ